MQQPNEPEKRRKFHFLYFLLAFLLIPIAAVGVCEITGWPFLRVPFERFAGEQLQRTVKIAEPFQLRLFGSFRLKVGGLWISAPAEFRAPHFVDSRNVNLQLRYADLYKLKHSDLLRIKSLEVDEIDARLIRNQDGLATWHFERDEDKLQKPFPVIETLIATKGHAEIFDAIHEADLKVDFSTHEGSANTQAASSINTQGRYRNKPLQAELGTDGFLPIATQEKEAPPIHSKGWVDYAGLHLDFDGTVSDLFGRQNIEGKFTARGPSLSVLGRLTNSVLPVTDKFSLSGMLEKYDAVWNVDVATARIGSSDLSGKFKYDPSPQIPSLSGELNGKRLVLADLAPAFGTRREDGSIVAPPPGKIIPDHPLDLPSLNKMDANIMVKFDHVDLGNAFAKPIRPLQADLTIYRGKLTLAEIDARTADGSLAGLISVDAHQDTPHASGGAPPQWRIDLNWKNIDLEKWLKVSEERKRQAKRKGNPEAPPAYVTGMLNGRTNLDGQGNSTHALLASLDGDVSMYIRKGTISHLLIELLGIDLAQSLGILLTKDHSLPMQCAVMDFGAQQGVVKPRVALIDTRVTLVLIDGNVDLAREQFNLRLTAKPKNVSPFTLRSPIRVKGTFLNPAATPEGGPIAARAAGSVALAFVNPLAALLPFIDLGSPADEPSPCRQTLTTVSNQSR